MALVCNRRTQISTAQKPDDDALLYLDTERSIEAGSAYFGRAFAEAIGLICDIELHDREGAALRLRSVASLLEHALREYEVALDLGSRSGLNEYHERKLRAAGLEPDEVRRVLAEAQSRGFLIEDDDRIETLAAKFDLEGHLGLMGLYMGKVREIYTLAVDVIDADEPQNKAVEWQELGWRLTALFTQALQVGKVLAILNTFTFRLPKRSPSSAENRRAISDLIS